MSNDPCLTYSGCDRINFIPFGRVPEHEGGTLLPMGGQMILCDCEAEKNANPGTMEGAQ